jgi:hypothetical protein
MNATTTQRLTTIARNAIAREQAAREALAASLLDMTQGVEPSVMRRVAEAAANALPYRILLENAESADFEKAFTTLRKRLTSEILRSGPGSSTCPFTNESERLRYDGSRAFLSDTDRFVEN